MSYSTMLFKNGERTRDFLGFFIFMLVYFLNISEADFFLNNYSSRVIIAKEEDSAEFAINHLISNARSWNK